MRTRWLILTIACLLLWFPPDSRGAAVTATSRTVPPPGLAISPEDRTELAEGAAELEKQIISLSTTLRTKPALLALLPDVQVFHKAVHWAVVHDEFYRSNEVAIAGTLLEQGLERARQLAAGLTPWTSATGLVVRAYVSKICTDATITLPN